MLKRVCCNGSVSLSGTLRRKPINLFETLGSSRLTAETSCSGSRATNSNCCSCRATAAGVPGAPWAAATPSSSPEPAGQLQDALVDAVKAGRGDIAVDVDDHRMDGQRAVRFRALLRCPGGHLRAIGALANDLDSDTCGPRSAWSRSGQPSRTGQPGRDIWLELPSDSSVRSEPRRKPHPPQRRRRQPPEPCDRRSCACGRPPRSTALPWDLPLARWLMPDVPRRDVAVGPSRHLVKFVDCGDALGGQGAAAGLAVRGTTLRHLEELSLNAVRPAGGGGSARLRHRIVGHCAAEWPWRYPFGCALRLPPIGRASGTGFVRRRAFAVTSNCTGTACPGYCSLANALPPGTAGAAGLVRRRRVSSVGAPALPTGSANLAPTIPVENVAGLGLADSIRRPAGRSWPKLPGPLHRAPRHPPPLPDAAGKSCCNQTNFGLRRRPATGREGHHPPTAHELRLRRRRSDAAPSDGGQRSAANAAVGDRCCHRDPPHAPGLRRR